jgi:hypothetical protein
MKLTKLLMVLAATLGCTFEAAAETGYYLVSTYPVDGQRAVDFKYWASKLDARPLLASPEIGLAYNVNSRWYTELTAAGFKMGAGATHLAAAEWQNDFMLTQGQYPFDLALHTNIERATDGSGEIGIEYGPVLQTEVGRTQFNLNLFFQRELHAEQREPTKLAYQWQVKYRWKEKLQWGVQGFGELGEWNHWLPRRQQSHRIGPALFGTWYLGGKQEIRYEAALLTGKNTATHANTFSTRIQYVF